ncbi:hypothetical protein ACFL6S_31580 [Candidatus Poribacteria bacterium]
MLFGRIRVTLSFRIVFIAIGVLLGSLIVMNRSESNLEDKVTSFSSKEFHTTVDFNDDIRKARARVVPENIYHLMENLAKLGIKRIYWIHNAEDHCLPQPFTDPNLDLLTVATDAAHRNRLEIYGLFKPFETGRSALIYPQNVKLPKDAVTIKGIGGSYAPIAPFVVKHPQYRLKRRPIPSQKSMRISAIKLVKSDSKKTRLNKENLQIWTSEINGDFARYTEDFHFTDSLEERGERTVRVLTLSGLEIPANHKYVLIEPTVGDEKGDFSNKASEMIELYDEQGERIISTVDEGVISRGYLVHQVKTYFMLRYADDSLPSGTIPPNYGKTLPQSGFSFDGGYASRTRTLDGKQERVNGHIAAVKGKNPYTIGAMHPAYPEVRKFWMNEIINRCVKVGMDGIDIRIDNHSSWTSEGEMYGFNEPVVSEYKKRYGVDILKEPYDLQNFKQINGEFLTLFLKELRGELEKHNVSLQLHVNALMEKKLPYWDLNNVPVNFNYEVERWIKEDIVDSIELKLIPFPWGSNEGAGVEFGERIAGLARKHNKPVFCNVRLEGRVSWSSTLWLLERGDSDRPISKSDETERNVKSLVKHMDWAWEKDWIDGIIVYEVAAYTHLVPQTGEAIVAPYIMEVLAHYQD